MLHQGSSFSGTDKSLSRFRRGFDPRWSRKDTNSNSNLTQNKNGKSILLCQCCRVGDLRWSVKPEPFGFGGSNPPTGTISPSPSRFMALALQARKTLVRIQEGRLFLARCWNWRDNGALEASVRKGVWVRIPPWPLIIHCLLDILACQHHEFLFV